MNRIQSKLLKGMNITILDSLNGYLLLRENGFGFSIMAEDGFCPLSSETEEKILRGWELVKKHSS
jgi:hypothetical protein